MTPDQLSTTLAALSDPTRRAILARLASGEATVTELSAPFAMSLPAVSRHLKVLRAAGLIAQAAGAVAALPAQRQAAQGRLRLGGALSRVLGAELRSLGRLPAQAEKKGEETWPKKEARAAKPVPDREIVIARVFVRLAQLVWDAWTDPKQVVQWWGPKGFTTTIHEMDVRPGGVWRHHAWAG